MVKGPRIDNEVLLNAGLELMRQNGKPLTKLPSKGRSMLFELPSGETVRARTCNDHILIAVAKSPEEGASLNIEGTDWILLTMPEVERMPGNVIAYLLPTQEVVDEVRRSHKAWLDAGANTKGANTTWNIWFRGDGPGNASGYDKKWAQYRLKGNATTSLKLTDNMPAAEAARPGGIKGEVEAARQNIANVAGVPLEAVKITIDFGA